MILRHEKQQKFIQVYPSDVSHFLPLHDRYIIFVSISIMLNGIFLGKQFSHVSISSLVSLLLKERICYSPLEQILSCKCRPHFRRAILSKEANRKSQKLFFVRMTENQLETMELWPQASSHWTDQGQ